MPMTPSSLALVSSSIRTRMVTSVSFQTGGEEALKYHFLSSHLLKSQAIPCQLSESQKSRLSNIFPSKTLQIIGTFFHIVKCYIFFNYANEIYNESSILNAHHVFENNLKLQFTLYFQSGSSISGCHGTETKYGSFSKKSHNNLRYMLMEKRGESIE